MKVLYWVLGSTVALVSLFGAFALAVPITFPPEPPPFIGNYTLFTPALISPGSERPLNGVICEAVNVTPKLLDMEVTAMSGDTGSPIQIQACSLWSPNTTCLNVVGFNPDLSLGAVFCRITIFGGPKGAVRGSISGWSPDFQLIGAFAAQ